MSVKVLHKARSKLAAGASMGTTQATENQKPKPTGAGQDQTARDLGVATEGVVQEQFLGQCNVSRTT